ncbi:FAD/NAD(P)-binding domain-containing protein [Corynespora cassiicola Philippines]|uniref:FAD/NAD(P)-binding domain-containing protein n=1 Tax=Corynespora cassiicola Philippines TaxID=1448308 RepID=A0A2T2NUM3_CORCC|nr:FAD/NAD(P)-binding domain-containing protein [Corynespora cassiicola Philippines]
MERKRIAIVGSGISGLSALWTLRNAGHEVHLYEKEERLGGHTNTAIWSRNGHETPVDTGFIVLNTATYPNFIEFLAALKVKTMPSQMTFGVSRDQGAFEWSGTSLGALFAQKFNIIKPSFWRMIFDIVRFNMFALDLLSSPAASEADEMSIGEYLEKEGYSDVFRDDYLIPMTACVWSTGPDKCALEFPALTLVRFMWNHHLLSTVAERPPWLTVEGGSKQYIKAVMRDCEAAPVSLGTPVESVKRKDDKVLLTLGGRGEGKIEAFDEVILACHGDQARQIIGTSATLEEKDILDAFETTPNTAYLHSDLSLMPQRRVAWAAWNYLTTSQDPSKPMGSASGDLQTVCLTYNMNILQELPTEKFGDVLVTLNPEKPPSPSLTQATYQYRHPLYNSRMIAAQENLERIQGKRGVWYAGAWTGYGFHEDGFSSGMRVGLRLGGSVPWEAKDAKFSRGLRPELGWKDYVVRVLVAFLQLYISLLDRVLGGRRSDNSAKTNGQANGKAIANGKAKAL